MSCDGVKERGSEDLEERGRVKGPIKGCGPGGMRWVENEKAGHARVPLRARFQRPCDGGTDWTRGTEGRAPY